MLRISAPILKQCLVARTVPVLYGSRFYSAAANTTAQIKRNNPDQNELKSRLDSIVQELNHNQNLAESYDNFNSLLLDLNAKRENMFTRNYIFNPVLSKLLDRSIKDTNISVDPTRVLDKYIQYGLARPHHFLILDRFYLNQGLYQDILKLWVKYLPTLTKIDAINFKDINDSIMKSTILAYMSLGGGEFKPDPKYLCELLNIQNIKMVDLLQQLQHSKLVKVDKDVHHGYQLLTNQLLSSNKDHFTNQVKQCINSVKLLSLYQMYEASILDDSQPNVELLITFINKFITLDEPKLAMKVFDTWKIKITDKEEKLRLNNHFLLIVSHFKINNKQKQTMIQAVWNTYFKMEFMKQPIPFESYCYLFNSLGQARLYQILRDIWELELTNDIKDIQKVRQCYWGNILNEKFEKDLTYNDVMEKYLQNDPPEKWVSPELAKTMLLRIILDPPSTSQQFNEVWDKCEPVRKQYTENDPTFIAIDLLSQYRYAKDKDEFNFIDHLKKKNFTKPMIIQSFINLVPTTQPIHKLYNQLANEKLITPDLLAMFINAEFTKSNGDPLLADELVKDHIFKITSNVNPGQRLKNVQKIDLKTILDSFIMSLATQKKPDIETVFKYLNVSLQWAVHLQNQTIHQAIFKLMKLSPEEISPEIRQLASSYLEAIMVKKITYKLPSKDRKQLQSLGLIIPPQQQLQKEPNE